MRTTCEAERSRKKIESNLAYLQVQLAQGIILKSEETKEKYS